MKTGEGDPATILSIIHQWVAFSLAPPTVGVRLAQPTDRTCF